MKLFNMLNVESEMSQEVAEAVQTTTEELVENTDKIELVWQPERFVDTLEYMGAGMLGIFIVIGLIVISTVILNKATAPKKDKK